MKHWGKFHLRETATDKLGTFQVRGAFVILENTIDEAASLNTSRVRPLSLLAHLRFVGGTVDPSFSNCLVRSLFRPGT